MIDSDSIISHAAIHPCLFIQTDRQTLTWPYLSISTSSPSKQHRCLYSLKLKERGKQAISKQDKPTERPEPTRPNPVRMVVKNIHIYRISFWGGWAAVWDLEPQRDHGAVRMQNWEFHLTQMTIDRPASEIENRVTIRSQTSDIQSLAVIA